jgi:transmembrane sensor
VPDQQVLPDGSVVVLRGGAEVSVEYSSAVRRVRLQRGEALFEVAKNRARPFIVRAAGLDVRAVGTAFAVNLQPSAVEVLVTEGQVAVQETTETASPPDDPGDGAIESSETRPTATPGASSTDITPRFPAWMLNAGKRIVVDFDTSAPPPQVLPVSVVEMNERLSWRVPRLQFARTPLREGVALINQYSRTHLILEGTELENLPLSGSIRADNIAALLELLELEYGIKAEHRSEREIVLREAP